MSQVKSRVIFPEPPIESLLSETSEVAPCCPLGGMQTEGTSTLASLFTQSLSLQHTNRCMSMCVHHHHEDAGDGHEDVGDGHHRLVG